MFVGRNWEICCWNNGEELKEIITNVGIDPLKCEPMSVLLFAEQDKKYLRQDLHTLEIEKHYSIKPLWEILKEINEENDLKF